jgi:hypothetical protein
MNSAVRLAAVCLVLASLLSCDDSQRGGTTPSGVSLSGIVTDVVSGAAIQGVALAVQNKTATTGSDGRYSIAGLTAGQATLTATHQGHRNFSQNVTLAGSATVNVPMTPSMAATRLAGTWRATTPSATAFTLAIAVDSVAQMLQMTLEVRGKRETFTVSYAPTSTPTTHTRTSTNFGNISVTVPPEGPITGTVTNPEPDILRIDFSVPRTGTVIAVNLTIRWTDGDVDTGTLTFTK